VRFADHTAFTRIDLDLDRNDQVYGVEVSDTVRPFAGAGDGQPWQSRRSCTTVIIAVSPRPTAGSSTWRRA
jgi:hypothetical protein